jgi:hypothetical protein
MKRLINILLFLILFSCTYYFINGILEKKTGEVDSIVYFYKMKKEKFDALFIGGSHLGWNVNPAIIWKEKGILSINLVGNDLPFWNAYYYLKEALKYQNPKVVVLEVYAAVGNWAEYQHLEWAYNNIHFMKFNKNKIDAVLASRPDNHIPLLLGFPIYHSRKDLTKEDFTHFKYFISYYKKTYPNGYWPPFREVIPQEKPMDHIIKTDLRKELPEKQYKYLLEIIRLTNENKIPLLLFAAPYVITENDQEHFNTVAEIAKENNLKFRNYNVLYEEISFDFSTDISWGNHLYLSGVEKLSLHLSNILAKEYGIPDHRQDPEYAKWNIWADNVMEELNEK